MIAYPILIILLLGGWLFGDALHESAVEKSHNKKLQQVLHDYEQALIARGPHGK